MAKFLHLLGRILFVLVFMTTGYEKLSQPKNFIPLYSKRFHQFEGFLKGYDVKIPQGLTSAELEPKIPLINQLVAYEMITFGLGVICFVPGMSLGLFLHIAVFTLIINNPAYYLPESKEYFHEIEQVTLSVALMGICLMFCCNQSNSDNAKVEEKVEEVETEKEKKKKGKESDSEKEGKKKKKSQKRE